MWRQCVPTLIVGSNPDHALMKYGRDDIIALTANGQSNKWDPRQQAEGLALNPRGLNLPPIRVNVTRMCLEFG